MKNFKRFLSLVLVIAMASSMILLAVSCGNEPEESKNPEETKAPATESESESKKETETPAESESESETKAETEEIKYIYKVTVLDTNGNPVVGATVQLCDDSSCKVPGVTGEDGSITFTYKSPSNYHATITASGYVTEETYDFPEGSTELTVTLTPEG